MNHPIGNSALVHMTISLSRKAPDEPSSRRRTFAGLVLCLLTLVVAVGCAKTETLRHMIHHDEKIPRPGHIWVHDFAATPAEIPAGSAFADEYIEHPTPQTPEQIAAGREVGGQIAAALVEEIRGMGLPAERASSETKPVVNDLVIYGYLLSVDHGSPTKRVTIGFGFGSSELMAAVEGFQMRRRGLRRLESGTIYSGADKGPGGVVMGVTGLVALGNPAGLIVAGGTKAFGEYSGSSTMEGRVKDIVKEIAERIKPGFQKQGWIE